MLSQADLITAFSPLFPPLIILVALIPVFVLMKPRRFYIVRHGETELNSKHIRQGQEGSLSDRGREQAERVGVYLANFPISRIICSTYQRAKETAGIINEHVHVPISYSPLFAERRNPSEIIGKSTRDPEVIRIVDEMDLAYHEDEYRFFDEETFLDLKARAKKSLDFLSQSLARQTIVVTHHHFLKMVLAYLLYREDLHAADFIKLSYFNQSDNAGISIIEYHPWRMFNATRGWEVVSFNEQPD